MMEKLAVGEDALTEWLSRSKKIQSVVKIPGDASTRSYYRVGADQTSYILMKMEHFEKEGTQLPFLVLQKHLKMSGIDVPTVLDVDPANGFILLEDLGDTTLLRKLQDVCTPDVERELYERVIDSLIDLQNQASPSKNSPPLEAFNLLFDHKKLMWEMNFTIEHFYKTYLGREMDPRDLSVMQNRLSEICTLLANEPVVFTHRDFHSRNVMVTPTADKRRERFVMIDFQDARMGPAQYDLASLLKDSYYQLDELQIERLLDYYIVRREALTEQKINRVEFRRMFDLMSVQRNFKAIGSFASFLNRRGNPGYLKYIGNTFENIRRTLLAYPEYSDLREVLFHYYYF